MPEQETVDQIFIAIAGVLGTILTGISADMSREIQASCESPIIRNSWTGILVLGVMMTLASVLYFWCTLSNDSCYTEYGIRRSTALYLAGFIFLGILIGTASVFLQIEYKKIEGDDKLVQQTNCGSEKARRYVIICMALSGVLVVGCSIALFLVMKNKKEEVEEEVEAEAVKEIQESEPPKKLINPRLLYGNQGYSYSID